MATIWTGWLSRIGAQVVVLVGEIEKWKPEKLRASPTAEKCGVGGFSRPGPVNKYTINYTDDQTTLGIDKWCGLNTSMDTCRFPCCNVNLR